MASKHASQTLAPKKARLQVPASSSSFKPSAASTSTSTTIPTSSPTSDSTSRPNSKTTPPSIPPPFTPAGPALQPLLAQCDPAKVYLFHIDRHPAAHKRAIFAIPVALNGAIAALLLWRVWAAAPTYWGLLMAVLGQGPRGGGATAGTTTTTSGSGSTNGTTETRTRTAEVLLVLRRAAMLCADFALLRLVGPWPLTFFAEQPANPVVWRWRLGFRGEEVVARVSRGWGSGELMGGGSGTEGGRESGAKGGAESPWFKTRVLPAVAPATAAKTGYLTMDRSWDLDFQLMLDAHVLVERKEVAAEELDGIALAFVEGPVGWCVWRWKEVERESTGDEELRKTVERLRGELAAE